MLRRMRRRLVLACVVGTCAVVVGCAAHRASRTGPAPAPAAGAGTLTAHYDERAAAITIRRRGEAAPLVTHTVRPDFRPYLHPIAAPDGRGVLTELSPSHHRHQTGLYWGFTRLNGRDYFHNPQGDHWRRVSAAVLQASGEEVRWQTVYDLLDAAGAPVLTETQRWSMRERAGRFELDLVWRGEARTDVTVARYDYGGLFLRMP
jgi:hypothetical protein